MLIGQYGEGGPLLGSLTNSQSGKRIWGAEGALGPGS